MKFKKIVLLVLAFVIVVSCGTLIWELYINKNDYAYDVTAKNGIIDAHSKDEIQKLLNKQVDKGMFNLSINSNPSFENGSSEGNLWIENVPNNTGDLAVIITIPNMDDKQVFETKKIKPNQNIKNAKLDVILPKGNYDAVAHFTAYDIESGKVIGNADVNIEISIEN